MCYLILLTLAYVSHDLLAGTIFPCGCAQAKNTRTSCCYYREFWTIESAFVCLKHTRTVGVLLIYSLCRACRLLHKALYSPVRKQLAESWHSHTAVYETVTTINLLLSWTQIIPFVIPDVVNIWEVGGMRRTTALSQTTVWVSHRKIFTICLCFNHQS